MIIADLIAITAYFLLYTQIFKMQTVIIKPKKMPCFVSHIINLFKKILMYIGAAI